MSGQQRDAEQVQAAETRMLASDADRDHTAGALNAAFAEGRLTAGEHAERVRATYAARTWQQLHQLTTDLPAERDTARQQASAPATGGLDWCVLCLLALCPPAGIAWLLTAWRRSRAGMPAAAAFPGEPPARSSQWSAEWRAH